MEVPHLAGNNTHPVQSRMYISLGIQLREFETTQSVSFDFQYSSGSNPFPEEIKLRLYVFKLLSNATLLSSPVGQCEALERY